MQTRPIEGLLYNYNLLMVTPSPQIEFQIKQIVRPYNKGGIKKHHIKWRGYEETFNCGQTLLILEDCNGSLLSDIAIRHFEVFCLFKHESQF
jgi:hypothetical protein